MRTENSLMAEVGIFPIAGLCIGERVHTYVFLVCRSVLYVYLFNVPSPSGVEDDFLGDLGS
jgi:hypothetical protein